MRTLCSAILLASLAGTAGGQVLLPDLYRFSVPDFDQRRSGLANNGGNHCVPTCHSNMLAYLASHGFPPVFPDVATPSLPSEYQDITDNIFGLGVLMGTSGTEGTTGSGKQFGLNVWLAPYFFLFTTNYQSGPQITPADLYWTTLAGGLVGFSYGRWEFIPGNGRYERTGGGHCVTLKGVENFWFPNFPAGQFPRVAYRDPASDEGNVPTRLTKQSPFTTTEYQLRPLVSNFKGYGITVMWEMITNSGDQYRRCIDGFTAIYPNFVLIPEATGLQMQSAINITDSPQVTHLNLPNISDFAFGGKPTDVFVITQPITGGPATLRRANVPANQVTHGLELGGPGGRVAPGRRGEGYVFNERQLRCLKPTMNGAFVDDATPVTILETVDALIYDDHRDGPTLLMGDGSVREYPRRLDGPPVTRSLSIGLSFSSLLHRVVPGITPGEYWFGPLTGNKIMKYVVAGDGSGRLVPADTLQLPAGGPPITDFAIGSSGNPFLTRNNLLEEWYLSPTGWAPFPGSVFTGMSIPGGSFRFSRSRTDYDPDIHSNPEWDNETDELGGDPPTNSTPDCPADVGRQGGQPEPDGLLNNNDFIVFIHYFFTQTPEADVGVQGGLPGFDGLFNNNDFIVFINDFFSCG